MVDAIPGTLQGVVDDGIDAVVLHVSHGVDAHTHVVGATGQQAGVGPGTDADLGDVAPLDPAVEFGQDAVERRAAGRLPGVVPEVVVRIDDDDADVAFDGVREGLDVGKRQSVVATQQDGPPRAGVQGADSIADAGVRCKDVFVESGHVAVVADTQTLHARTSRIMGGEEAERFADAGRAGLGPFSTQHGCVVWDACQVDVRVAVHEQVHEAGVGCVCAGLREGGRAGLERHRGAYRRLGLERVVELAIRKGNVLSMQGTAGPRAAPDAVADVLPGQTIAIEHGRIAWMGPDEEWDGDARKTIDAAGRLVTPGFVDAHTHLVYGGDRAFEMGMKLAGRSYMEILAAGGGIAYTREQTRALDVQGLVAQARPRLRRMLKNGTTSLEAKTGYALETAGELRMLEAGRALETEGARMAHTFLGAHAVPAEFKDDVDGYVDLVVDEMLPAVAKQGIATYCDVFVEEGVFTAAHGRSIFDAAKRHGLKARLHADEIVNTAGAQLAAEVGAVTADHLLRVSPEGIEAMAAAGTIATLLPTVPMTLMQPQWAPATEFLAAGVPVALASDHNPNNPITSMNMVTQLACYLLRMTPEQAWTGATWNAACSLGWQEDVGSLETGKRADIIVHDVPDLAHWAYEPGRSTIDTVVCAGRVVA